MVRIIISTTAERTADLAICLMEDPERDEDPQHIEEEQVDPEVHEIGRVKVLGAGKPFGAECHET